MVIQPEEKGTISIDEVKSDIIGIIDGNKDAISDVSVIKDGENGLIIIITVVDKSIESVVGSLKNCMNKTPYGFSLFFSPSKNAYHD